MTKGKTKSAKGSGPRSRKSAKRHTPARKKGTTTPPATIVAESSPSPGVPSTPASKPSAPLPAQRNDHQLRDRKSARIRKKLNLTPDSLVGVSRITPILSRVEGGRERWVEALRLSDDDDAHTFLKSYDGIAESDRAYLSAEELCIVADISTRRLLELVVGALVEDSKNASAIVAAIRQPAVVERLADSALWPGKDGAMDRRMFLTATGFLPSPPKSRDGSVFVTVNQQQNNLEGEVPVTGLPSSGPDKRFTTAEDELKGLHEAMDGQKLLKEPQQVIAASSDMIRGHGFEDTVGDRQELDCVPVIAHTP